MNLCAKSCNLRALQFLYCKQTNTEFVFYVGDKQ